MQSRLKIIPLVLFLLVLTGSCTFVACTHPVRRLVFQAHKIKNVPPFPEKLDYLERVWFETEQGRIESWIIRGEGVDASNPGPAVMIAHGNRELIDYYLDHAEIYRRMGFTVLLGEYRGYGRSEGKPSRDRIASDYKRFYDYLTSLPVVNSKQIVFHGRSLGGAVLSELSRYRPPAAIIVESTFTSIKAMAYGAPDFLLSDNYDTLSALLEYSGPILVIHGAKDHVVPVDHATNIKNQIPAAQLIIYDFGHSDGPPAWKTYWNDIFKFLNPALLH